MKRAEVPHGLGKYLWIDIIYGQEYGQVWTENSHLLIKMFMDRLWTGKWKEVLDDGRTCGQNLIRFVGRAEVPHGLGRYSWIDIIYGQEYGQFFCTSFLWTKAIYSVYVYGQLYLGVNEM